MLAHKLVYSSRQILNFYNIQSKLSTAQQNCFQVVDKESVLVRCSLNFAIPAGTYLISACGGGGSGCGGGDRGSGDRHGGGGGGSSALVERTISIQGGTTLQCIVGNSDQDTYINTVRSGATVRILTAAKGASRGRSKSIHSPDGIGGGGNGGSGGGQAGSAGATYVSGLPGGAGGSGREWERGGGGGGAGSHFPYLVSIAASIGGQRGGGGSDFGGAAGKGWGAGGGGGSGNYDYTGPILGSLGNIGVIYIRKA